MSWEKGGKGWVNVNRSTGYVYEEITDAEYKQRQRQSLESRIRINDIKPPTEIIKQEQTDTTKYDAIEDTSLNLIDVAIKVGFIYLIAKVVF